MENVFEPKYHGNNKIIKFKKLFLFDYLLGMGIDWTTILSITYDWNRIKKNSRYSNDPSCFWLNWNRFHFFQFETKIFYRF